MRKRLESEGVEPLYFLVRGEKTGVCACLLTPGGKRSMCTRQGAAAKFSVQNLYRPDLEKWIEKAKCIFVVGYFLVHSPDVVVTLADMCCSEQVNIR